MTTGGRTTGPSDERFDEAVQSLLAERGRTTNGDIRAILEGLDGLPARSAGRARPWLAAAAAIAILVIGGGFALGRLALPSFGPGGETGRAAHAGDPRLAECEAQIGSPAAQAFEMTHASWFPLYFPGWSRGAPELEVDDPALVVIGPQMPGMNAVPRANDDPSPATTPSPMFRMCIAVGASGNATVHDYGYTWFDRIVPVLSADDIAKAAHLDPDVLADPSAWPFPDRLARCEATTGNELYVFELVHLSDFRRHFPNAQPNDQIDAEDGPAIAVVYRDPLQTYDRLAPPKAWERDVCLILEIDGARPDHLTLLDVDTRGLHVWIDGTQPEPSDEPTMGPSEPVLTPIPAPSWSADLLGQLQCTGPASTIGGEVPSLADMGVFAGDAASALATFLGPSNFYASLPTDGFRPYHLEDHWAEYAYFAQGRIKALIVLSDTTTTRGDGWTVTGMRACDASEFDPAAGLTSAVTIWTDADGQRVSTEKIVSYPGPAHCGHDESTWLTVDGVLYFRDPKHVMADWVAHPFDADAKLPSDALDSGYRSESGELWIVPEGDAYLVATDHVERWPRSTDQTLGCA